MNALPALLLLALLAAPGDPSSLYGRRIVSLSFRGDAPLNEKVFAGLTDLGPGKTLTEPSVRAAFRNLFATGRFSDLSLEAAVSDDGVALEVVFSAAPRVSSFRVEAPGVPERGRLRDAVALAPGDRWSPAREKEIQRLAGRHLRERGFPDGVARVVVEAGAGADSVDVTLVLEPGKAYASGSPDFEGATLPIPASELAKAGKLRAGKPFREARAREDTVRYEARLRKAGYARAEIRFEGASVDGTGRFAPRYHVYVGPRLVLRVDGEKVKTVRNHADSPWQRAEPADEETFRRLAQGLKRSYQESGYAKARVTLETETKADEETVSIHVEKGDRWSVRHVGFDGRQTLAEGKLRGALRTQARGFIASGRFVEADAEQDRETAASLYRADGYTDARVGTPTLLEGASPFTFDVTFPVEEGLRAIVGARAVTGNSGVPTADLLKLLTVDAGKPFSQSEVDQDLNALRVLYQERGYASSRVDADVRILPAPPPESNRATVTYVVVEGEPLTFGKTVIRGPRKTHFSVLRRALAYKEGEPYSLAKLLQTRQNLARLGVFDRIELSGFPADPSMGSRSVLVEVAEGKPWSLVYGAGVEYDQNSSPRFNPRLSLGVSYANLFGEAITATADARYSRRDSRLLASLRTQPLWDLKIPLTLTAFEARVLNQAPKYEVRRSGVFLEGQRYFGAATRVSLRYQYELVRPTADDPTILSALERQNQQIQINSIGPALYVDTRDDPIDPKRGFLLLADGKWAFPAFSADAHFLKGFAQTAVYRPFAGGTLSLAGRVGVIEPLSPCHVDGNPGCLPNLEIPIAERFFGGGRSSHRAFALDNLGVPGQTLDKDANGIGGAGLLVFNAEYRFPIAGGIGGTVFFDYGQVFAGIGEIGFSGLRPGAGVGLRYLTPFGPVRLEYGLKLDKQPRESAGELAFSIGYPF